MNFENSEAVAFVTAAEEYTQKAEKVTHWPVGWPGTYWLNKSCETFKELLETEESAPSIEYYDNVAVATYISKIIDEWEWFLSRLRGDNSGVYRAMRYLLTNVVNAKCVFCKGRFVKCVCMCDDCGRMIVVQSKGVWFCVHCRK